MQPWDRGFHLILTVLAMVGGLSVEAVEQQHIDLLVALPEHSLGVSLTKGDSIKAPCLLFGHL